MDIKQLKTRDDHDAGAEMQVIGPDGKVTDVYIRLVGVDSVKWRGIRSRIEKSILLEGGGKDEQAEYVAEATLDWRGLTSNGQPLPFSKEAAIELYKNAPYICDQADRFIARRLNFINASLME